MEYIKKFFEYDSECWNVSLSYGTLVARTNIVIFEIVEPHDGTDEKWLFRATTVSAFDRWANSTAVEMYFQTELEVANYLYAHQLDIYKSLLEYLSDEYNN